MEILKKIRSLILETPLNSLQDQSSMSKLIDSIQVGDELFVESDMILSFNEYRESNNYLTFVYLQVLVWFLIRRERTDGIKKIARLALNDPQITTKQFWFIVLEEIDDIEPIYSFFKANPNYGDRFDTERFILILSDSKYDIGSAILEYLNSEYEIIVSATLLYLETKNMIEYKDDIIKFFMHTVDTDLIIQSAEILNKWMIMNELIENKITQLELKNKEYFQDTISDLVDLL